MGETMTPEQMLDTLADFQAQADYLEMQKRELLDAVKIPDEVIAAQDEANKAKRLVDEEYRQMAEAIAIEKQQKLTAVAIPKEIEEIYRRISAERLEIEKQQQRLLGDAWNIACQKKERIDNGLNDSIADVYNQVQIRKSEIAAEFDGKAVSVKDNIAKLTAEIKDTVKQIGKTIKGQFLMAKYVKGRDGGWDNAKLEGFALAHPEILVARKPDGAPSISICKI